MKWLPTLIICLLMVAVFVPCLTVSAQSLIPHEDPSAAKSTLDSFSFLSQYTQIFSLMSAQDYINASKLSEYLTHITVPADLSYIINRYNNLTQQLINTLSDLQSTLNTASNLLDQYRLTEADQTLDRAGILVSQAQILLSNLQDATTTLSRQLGVFATQTQSKVAQAYNQLESMLQQLNDLINRYHTLLHEANQKEQQIKSENLAPTTLTLTLNTTKCFVGGYIDASGVLSSKGQVMPDRKVQLLLDGNQVLSANTQADGTYNAIIQIPYAYISSMTVDALYTPAGNDQGVYLAALSPTATLQVLFYSTYLNVSFANVAYPGLSLSIKGTVTSTDKTPLSNRQITVLLDKVTMAQTVTDQSGVFSAKFTIKSNATLGTHTLTVNVAPSGLYAGVSVQKTLTIQKMASTIKISTPSFVILPSKLQINGTLNSASGPLSGANILIQFENITIIAKTSNNGQYNSTLTLPPNSILAGYQSLTITAQPSQPWQATAQTKVSIFLLNSVSTGIALASSLSIFCVAFLSFQKTRTKKIQETLETSNIPDSQGNAVTTVVASRPELKFEGNKGAVLKAYVDALKAVEHITGYSLTANMTMREFMQKTEPAIGKATTPFSKLTVMAEKSLYSPHEPETEDLERAKNLALEIGRTLNHENI